MSEQLQYLFVLIVYLVAIFLWAIYKGKGVKSKSEYNVVGRKLPGWIAALSERAAGESSWALLGLPGFAYATGLSSIWTAVGCMAGIITVWLILAWRFRDEAEKYNACSYTELISKKLNTNSKIFRAILSLIIVFFFFFYIGAQFIGGGKTFNTLFNIDLYTGIVIMAIVIIPYAIYGGMKSVVYADVIQSILMIFILVFVPIYGTINLLFEEKVFASTISLALTKAGSSYTNIIGDITDGFSFGTILHGISWFFGYLGGQPQLSIRFMSIKDKKNAIIGRNVGIIWTLFAYIGALTIGWLGIAYFGPSYLKDQEQIMPELLKHLFNPVITGIFITAIIAAILSTADSLIIISSVELSENIIKPLFYKNDSLVISRMVTFLIAILAMLASFFTPTRIIYDLVGYVWAGVGNTFSVIVLFMFFSKQFDYLSALITAVLGILFTVIWINSGLERDIITSRIATFIVCTIIALFLTILKKRKNFFVFNFF